MKSVSIRLDDVDGETCPSFVKLLDRTCANADARIEIAVIPFRAQLSSSFLDGLAESRCLDISLHGHSHIKRCVDSEFRGLDIGMQCSLITEAASVLGDLPNFSRKFVPPWNAYDQNTLECLQHLGLNRLGTSYKRMIECESAIFIEPISIDIRDFIRNLNRLKRKSHWHANLMCHTYDFKEFSDKGFTSAKEFFNLLIENQINIVAHKDFKTSHPAYSKAGRFLRSKLKNRIVPLGLKIDS